MYYYTNYKVSVDLRIIPETEERQMLQESNKGAIESFVEEYCLELAEDGIPLTSAFEKFRTFVNDNNFRYQCKKMTFNAEMTKYCRMVANGKYKQAARNKAGVRAFMFSDEMKNRYADLIRLKNDELQKDIKVNFDLSADDDTDSDIPVRGVVEY